MDLHSLCGCGRSGDSTARIWDLSKLAEGGEATSISLPHSSPDDKEKPKDVTTLDWSGNGQLLATGSYDGLARVWSKEGALPGPSARHAPAALRRRSHVLCNRPLARPGHDLPW